MAFDILYMHTEYLTIYFLMLKIHLQNPTNLLNHASILFQEERKVTQF